MLPFDPPDPDLTDLPPSLRPYAEEAPARFGTSSFSSKDWVGPFYPKGMPPGQFLSHYARIFDTVEIDATYYAIPSPRTVDGWVAKTPESFRICCKFPRSIVHGGDGARPDGRVVLDPASTYLERDRFLEVMSRLGARLDTLLLQFPYFNRSAFPSGGRFLDRLERFLKDFDFKRFRLAVEIRNKAWLTDAFRDLLAAHGASLVLVDQGWMPHGDEVQARFDTHTGDRTYIRLLGDRKAIEKITKTWEKEVMDHGDRLERWAQVLVNEMQAGRRTLVFVNNHYAGHAPATVRRLRRRYQAALEAAKGAD